jgi:ankyrin repeat protein
LLRHRTHGTGTDRLAVDANGCDNLRARSGEETLVGREKTLRGNGFLGDFHSQAFSQEQHRRASDAHENSRLGRRCRHATAFESWPRRRGWVMGLSLARVSTRMAPPAGAVEMFGHASTIPSVTIGLPDESYAGTVGALALKDYRVTFDARNESIYLEPNPTPDPVAESIAAGWDATSRDLFGHTPLALACMANNTALVHELLEAGISPAGSKELSEAIFIGNASHARLLIEAGAEVDDKDGKALWAAAQGGQVAIVRMLLEAGAKVSSASESAFGAALRHGETEITRLLLEAGADFTLTRGDESIPALHLASAGGHSDTAKLLLDAGADVDARSKDGVTALWRAVVTGHTETAKMLLEHRPDLSVKDGGGNSLLHAAASLGHARLVELLLGAGLDPMVMNASNASPLIAAATGTGSPEVAALLIERGADPDSAWAGQNDFPALHFASYNGHDELAALLIERGADVNHTAGSETTSLHGAARSGQVEIVALLLDAGAAIDAVDADGKTPLATAADSGYILTFAQLGAPGAENEKKTAQELMAEGHTEGVEPDYPGTVALLLERGADPSLLPDDGAETLHSLAIDWHQIKNIRTLLERGLDPAKSPRPLGLAGLAGNTEIAELLIQHGANALDASEALDQAFLLAVKYGHLQTAQVLLEQGADARAVAHKSKMNAFHLAVRHEHEALFDLLLAAGADPNARDIDANAPLHLAASENRLESARVLLEAGADPSLKNAILMDPQTIAKYNSPKNENLVTLLEEATKSEGP